VDFKEQIDAWFRHMSTRKPGTARTYKVHAGQFFAWLEDRPLTRFEIEDYVTYCCEKNYSKSTINCKLSAVQSFCKWYCPRHSIDDPSIGLKHFSNAETKPKKQRFLTDEEYGRVLEITRPGIERDTFEFLANTGLRRAEYCAVKLTDIDKKGTHLIVRHGKGDKERRVPLNSKMRDIIARNTTPEKTLLCVTYWKGRGNNVWEECQSLARRAQVPAFGPHACRHYFATKLIKNGVPLKMVSQILGHSSVLMTEQIYCHLLPEDTTGVTECLCS
jgi:integrase